MPYYQRRGALPRKRHVAFRGEGGRLLPEELVGNKGFTGPASLLHHLHMPTDVRQVRAGELAPHGHHQGHRSADAAPGELTAPVLEDRAELSHGPPLGSRWAPAQP